MSNFMKYSNETQSNIIPKEEFQELVLEVFNVISKNLSKSLGPLGSSTTILDGMTTEATKDGYAILKKFNFMNRYKRMIYHLILAPCTEMNNIVGDATTTAITLTAAMFTIYKQYENKLEGMYRLPREFNKQWDRAIEDIVTYVKDHARPIESDDYDAIYNLAYVTSNGNEEISRIFAKTYQDAKTPAIKQKDSPTNKSYINEVNGFEFPANLLSDAYVRNEDMTAEEKDICVMIFNHKIETDVFNKMIAPINDVLRAQDKKLLIIAPFYDAYMCDTVLDQYVNMEYQRYRKINLILSQYPIGKLEKYQLEDLAVVLRAKLITESLQNGFLTELETMGSVDMAVEKILEDSTYPFYRLIGGASYALLSTSNGAIFRVNNIEEDQYYKDALNHAKQELKDIQNQTEKERASYSAKIYEANARLLQLQMKNYIYYVGADNALQKNILWDSIEDVIKCIRSAIKYGVVPGCQLTIIKAIDELSDSTQFGRITDEDKLYLEILSIIRASVVSVYRTVLNGPDGTGIVKLFPNWNDVKDNSQVELLVDKATKRLDQIVVKSIKDYKVFDLEALDYSDRIITSAQTDWLVLRSASALVKTLISGNQCVFLDAELNDAHQENFGDIVG